jgi:hypothetical protein
VEEGEISPGFALSTVCLVRGGVLPRPVDSWVVEVSVPKSDILEVSEEDLSTLTGLLENSRLNAEPTLEERIVAFEVSPRSLVLGKDSFFIGRTVNGELFNVIAITADNLLLGGYSLLGRLMLIGVESLRLPFLTGILRVVLGVKHTSSLA